MKARLAYRAQRRQCDRISMNCRIMDAHCLFLSVYFCDVVVLKEIFGYLVAVLECVDDQRVSNLWKFYLLTVEYPGKRMLQSWADGSSCIGKATAGDSASFHFSCRRSSPKTWFCGNRNTTNLRRDRRSEPNRSLEHCTLARRSIERRPETGNRGFDRVCVLLWWSGSGD